MYETLLHQLFIQMQVLFDLKSFRVRNPLGDILARVGLDEIEVLSYFKCL